MRVLVLGGTGEARELAAALQDRAGIQVTSSLAGRVDEVRRPAGDVRIGGFGGASGLSDWLRTSGTDAVIDATHPFATQITASAAEAARSTGTPLLVVRRPGWQQDPGDDWHRVPNLDAAAAAVDGLGSRVFLTIGRQGVGAFARLDHHWFLVRSIEPPGQPMPTHHELLLDRGPFTVPEELQLFRRHAIGVLVTKDSGGAMTVAKMVAARELRLPVVMVRRPPLPAGVQVVDAVDKAVAWVDSCPQPSP